MLIIEQMYCIHESAMLLCAMQNSRRVYRYSGTKEIANVKTGEVERAVVVKQKVQDVNFIKIFLPEGGYRMYPMDMTPAAKELLEYLMVIMDKTNTAIAPVVEIRERMDLSAATITRAKAQLFEMDYIRQRAANVYMVNPGHCCKASGDNRQAVFHAYSLLPHKGKHDEGTSED